MWRVFGLTRDCAATRNLASDLYLAPISKTLVKYLGTPSTAAVVVIDVESMYSIPTAGQLGNHQVSIDPRLGSVHAVFSVPVASLLARWQRR